MKTRLSTGIAALVAGLGLAAGALATPLVTQPRPYDSSLSKIGNSIAYPVKKAAGNGSKAVNHGAKSAEYPVRKTGVNASKTAHKTAQKVVPKK